MVQGNKNSIRKKPVSDSVKLDRSNTSNNGAAEINATFDTVSCMTRVYKVGGGGGVTK